MYKNFRKMVVIYKGSRGALLISQVLLFLSVATNQVIMALNARLINDGVQASNINVVISTAIWMMGLTLVLTVFSVGNAIYAVMFAEGTANFLRVTTFRKIQTFSFGNLDRFRTGDLLVRLTADINNVKSAVLFGVMNLLQAPFTIVVVLAITWIIAPSQLWLMVIIMVVVAVVLFSLLRNIQRLFKLRQDAMWSDGNPVTAKDIEYSVKRAVMPETASPYAFVLYAVKNAAAINQTVIPTDTYDIDSLGVKALDDYTVEFTLEAPAAYFESISSMWTLRPLPSWAVEEFGDAWTDPANIVVNGPFKLTEFLLPRLIGVWPFSAFFSCEM